MSNARKIVSTNNAPSAIGPYSQGITDSGRLVFVSGQLPVDPVSGNIADGDIDIQTRQSLSNLKEVLKAAGAQLTDVAKTTVFLSDMNNFAAMNAVYTTFFPENAPARSAVQVARLPKDVLVEIEAIAII